MKVVTKLRLEELWDESGAVEATSVGDLSSDQVRELPRQGAAGVVATVGKPLRWLRDEELFSWWKAEATPRLVEPERQQWRLEDLPDERCWVASGWVLRDGARIVVFEERH